MKYINLTKGKRTLVDDKNFESLNKHKWRYCDYPIRAIKIKVNKFVCWRMHWEIMGKPKKGLFVDHINGNKLDNREKNLRIVNQNQNSQNSAKRKNTSSRYKGVFWHKQSKKWRSKIIANKKLIYLGTFDTELLAYKAYCVASKKYHGQYGRI